MRGPVVVALGGNAFVTGDAPLTMAGQFRFAHEALLHLMPLFEGDNGAVLVHGNGPQVGHMLTRVEQSLGEAYAIPLEVCVAESEGELGYVLQQSLHNLLVERRIERPVVSVLTQVVVAGDDPAFGEPTKPIGPYYDAERARKLEGEGFALTEVVGRGFRRVVPSPEPLEIVESSTIEMLTKLGVIVIAAGGGGIPVVRRGDRLEGVDAVVDKDLTGALLASDLGATTLVVLTGVPCAYTDFGTPRQAPIGKISPEEARELAASSHFAAGSMGPKIEAAARFAEGGGRAIVCDPPSVEAALAGTAGTIVEARVG